MSFSNQLFEKGDAPPKAIGVYGNGVLPDRATIGYALKLAIDANLAPRSIIEECDVFPGCAIGAHDPKDFWEMVLEGVGKQYPSALEKRCGRVILDPDMDGQMVAVVLVWESAPHHVSPDECELEFDITGDPTDEGTDEYNPAFDFTRDKEPPPAPTKSVKQKPIDGKIRFQCPHCSKKFSVAPKFGGKKGKCPGCDFVIKIPPAQRQDAGPNVPQTKAPEKIRFRCPKCNKSVSVAVQRTGKRGKCPGCNTVIDIPKACSPAAREEQAYAFLSESTNAVCWAYWHCARAIWKPPQEIDLGEQTFRTVELKHGAREAAVVFKCKGELSPTQLKVFLGLDPSQPPFTRQISACGSSQIEALYQTLYYGHNMSSVDSFSTGDPAPDDDAYHTIPAPPELDPQTWGCDSKNEVIKPSSFDVPSLPEPNPAVAFSQFANELRCIYCREVNVAPSWPRNGDMVPFYNQSKERTKEAPGAYKVSVICPHCRKKWFVVWDSDPT